MKKTLLNIACTTLAFLMCFASCARADSLFDLLPVEPTQAPTQQDELAPSYGYFANVQADEETQNEAGDTIVTYQNVSVQQMSDFGVELEKEGYQVLGKETKDEMVAYQLSNNIFTFTVFYDQASHTLHTVYPNGIAFVHSLFPGYKKVKLGETFKIKDLAEFTFNKVYLCKDLPSYYSLNLRPFVFSDLFLIEFTYKNIATSKRSWYTASDGIVALAIGNLFGNEVEYASYVQDIVKMIYLNEDNMYSFIPVAGGYYEQGDETRLRGDEDYTSNGYRGYRYVEPLEIATRAIGFEPPQTALDDQAGTLGLAMDFPNGEKYVLILRENGRKYY